ncbi:SH3-domain-containing protein [Lyophyllum atratum]|nr:SH3-domain-containing protein [Lyophyllum atratum]
MVFANLQSHEKDAFFSLLDEYFTSRPDVFGNVGGSADQGAGSSASGAAASAVHRAFASNPEATSRLVSAGLKHGVPKSSPYSAAASDPEVNNAAGRVAAASLAFSGRNSSTTSPPPARSAPPIAEKPAASGLVSSRKFGDIDTTSKGKMLGSLYTPGKVAPSTAAPVVPAAFAAKKNAFAPPPTRRASSSTSPPLRQQPPPEPEEEEQGEQGEWAEALYDYDSGEPGDLAIRADERVLVTERTSDDWWTGEYNGRKGLFPASYVKIL